MGTLFQYSWLSKYSRLRYSEHCNGGFCLPCVLFAKIGGFCSAPDLFARKPLGESETHFVKAVELIKQHKNRVYHKQSVVALEEFVKVMSNKQLTVQQLMNRIETNRAKIQSILQTIVLCGRQNIPLHGHHDSSLDKEKDPCAHHGNFWALLDFRVSCGDAV